MYLPITYVPRCPCSEAKTLSDLWTALPNHNPYTPSFTPVILDIAITKKLSIPVYLTSCSALSSGHLPVLIDSSCRLSFQHPPDGPDLRRTDWTNFQTLLEEVIPFDPELRIEMAIESCVEKFCGAGLKAQTALPPTRHDPRLPITDGIQEGIRLKPRLRSQRQITRDPALKAEVNRLQRSVIHQPNEWRNNQWSATHESFDPEDQSLWRMSKRVMRVPTQSPPGPPGGIALSDSEKAEALEENLKPQFQPVTDPSIPAVIETVDVVLRTYFLSLASEQQLTTPDEVNEAIRGLRASKAKGRNGIPNRALKHFPKRAVSLLALSSTRFSSPITFPQRGSTLE